MKQVRGRTHARSVAERIDAVVIGSGQGGVPLATKLAGEGKRVVLFEREAFGGSCIDWGCTPTKAFLAAAHAAGRAREAAALGVRCGVEVDFARVMERARHIRDRFAEGVRRRLGRASRSSRPRPHSPRKDTSRAGDALSPPR